MNKLLKLLIAVSIPIAVWKISKKHNIIQSKDKKDISKEKEELNLFI